MSLGAAAESSTRSSKALPIFIAAGARRSSAREKLMSERSANFVWPCIGSDGKVVLWNSLPFHCHEQRIGLGLRLGDELRRLGAERDPGGQREGRLRVPRGCESRRLGRRVDRIPSRAGPPRAAPTAQAVIPLTTRCQVTHGTPRVARQVAVRQPGCAPRRPGVSRSQLRHIGNHRGFSAATDLSGGGAHRWHVTARFTASRRSRALPRATASSSGRFLAVPK